MIARTEKRETAGGRRWRIRFAALIIALAAIAAYSRSLSGALVFDDHASITDNPTIRSLWPIAPLFSPPANAGVGGRPVLNISFALNYAAGGLNPWGYHAVNLAIHILAGLALFGVVRRTLDRRGPSGATTLAFAIALLWTVHPLQTEAVTYVSERAESLMGLFYLLTIYGFIRHADGAGKTGRGQDASATAGRPLGSGGDEASSPRAEAASCRFYHGRWGGLSIAAGLLGMATKEVMVTAPLMVLLYDRTFVSGSFRESWRRRRWYYAGLAATWLVLGHVVAHARGQGVGLGMGGTWRDYALTESRAIVRYLGLALWPHPLVFDYGPGFAALGRSAVPWVLIVAALVATTAFLITEDAYLNRKAGKDGKILTGEGGPIFRLKWTGFAGAWFFLILAPTSSVIAVAGQPVAEHRMYLPLAAVMTLVAGGIFAVFGGSLVGRVADPAATSARPPTAAVILVCALAVGFGALTYRRNQAYRSEISLWSDTVAKRPGNERAQNALGLARFRAGETSAAIARYREALRLNPGYPEAQEDLGAAFQAAGRRPEAVAALAEAVRLRPASADYRYNLGVALQGAGRPSDAAAQFELALRLEPAHPEADYDLGALRAGQGRWEEAVAHYQAAIRLKPDEADVRYDLANALVQLGRGPEAMLQFEAALRIDPRDAAAHNNLGIALAGADRLPEAIAQLRDAARLAPNRADYHFNLGVVLLREDRVPDARVEFERARALRPGYAAAQEELEQLQSQNR